MTVAPREAPSFRNTSRKATCFVGRPLRSCGLAMTAGSAAISVAEANNPESRRCERSEAIQNEAGSPRHCVPYVTNFTANGMEH
jgi:hypothetical protein